MREIELTRGFVALIDDEDYGLVSSMKWYADVKKDGSVYASRKSETFIGMHRLITGCPRGMYVDHINGNPLDNRRANLRVCTQSQNLMNRGKTRLNTSGVKGVTWQKSAKKWMAQIDANGEHHYLGLFSRIEDAARARAEAEEKYHGSFARLQ